VAELLELPDVRHQEPQHHSRGEVTQDPEILKFPRVMRVQQLWLDLAIQPWWAWVVREQVQPLPVLVLEPLQRVQLLLALHRRCCRDVSDEQTEEYSQPQCLCLSCYAGSLAEPCPLNPNGRIEGDPSNPNRD